MWIFLKIKYQSHSVAELIKNYYWIICPFTNTEEREKITLPDSSIRIWLYRGRMPRCVFSFQASVHKLPFKLSSRLAMEQCPSSLLRSCWADILVQTHQYAKKCGFGIIADLHRARWEHGQRLFILSAYSSIPLTSCIWLQLLVTLLYTPLLYTVTNRSDTGPKLYFDLFVGIDRVIQCLSAWQHSSVVSSERTEWKHWSREISFWAE